MGIARPRSLSLSSELPCRAGRDAVARRAELSRYALESVDRMVSVIDALAAAREQSLEQVARSAGLNESTALRYLLSLTKHGFVDRNEQTGLFRLGLALFRLGTLAVDSRDVLLEAGQIMTDLQQRFGESINLAAHQRDKIVLIKVLGRPDAMRKEGGTGDVDPWHATALGKAVLAALPPEIARDTLAHATLHRYTPNTRTDLVQLERDLTETRIRGYSIDDEEAVEGLRCVGVAVNGRNGEAEYALSVSGPKSRMSQARIEEIGAVLIEAAADLSERLGGS